ncbi:MAG: dihydrofolate reductase family protein [Actinomycetia bacterium]|nr:dihydrofolate reductase family protein [Actinomycetes bacterium]
MRALLPEPLPDPDLHAWYATDWSDRGGLRMSFVASADGAASASGSSRGLQTPGDQRVFRALRDLADVLLVGAGTARAEGYRGAARAVAPDPRRRATREAHGFAPDLPLAVVSRSLRLGPLLARAPAAHPASSSAPPPAPAPESAPPPAPAPESTRPGAPKLIVITCAAALAAADAALRDALDESADLVIAGDAEVDLALALDALRQRGHRRILGEGGPTLFASLIAAGLVDELCLSVAPRLAGPGASRIVAGAPWPQPPLPLRLAGLLEDDGALFCRYRRPGDQVASGPNSSRETRLDQGVSPSSATGPGQ